MICRIMYRWIEAPFHLHFSLHVLLDVVRNYSLHANVYSFFLTYIISFDFSSRSSYARVYIIHLLMIGHNG